MKALERNQLFEQHDMCENVFNKIRKGFRAEEEIANELDCVEQTSCVLFLKYLDDLRQSLLQKAFAGELT